MAKTKTKKSSRSAETSSEAKTKQQEQQKRDDSARWWREAIESIVVAIVLALLFRTFEAEAFVIPTGSMAPTLQGQHKDVECPKCGYLYRVGASKEQEAQDAVVATTCPMCRYTMMLNPEINYNHASFTGDRILVNKFAYQFSEPKRWDVIVFKFPGNAKQNYIKRLVGLAGETIRIRSGDVFINADGSDRFRIARKPPRKIRAMLQLVHDTDYIPEDLIALDWPARWASPESRRGVPDGDWQTSSDRRTYRLSTEESGRESWLRYRHIVPSYMDWDAIESGLQPEAIRQRSGQLITDYYPYNAGIHENHYAYGAQYEARNAGLHWVGDLAVECEVNVESSEGEILLDLVEGGRHYQCRINVSDGSATLTIDGGEGTFDSLEDGSAVRELRAVTPVNGPGEYMLRFANVDDQLLLWVDNRAIPLGGSEGLPSATYKSPTDVIPVWSPDDPGDLAPVGVGGKDIQLTVTRLRVLRDVYYIATHDTRAQEPAMDYDSRQLSGGRHPLDLMIEIQEVFNDPSSWEVTPLFASRRTAEFSLGDDEFFPLGDNSPQSKDARLWHTSGPPRIEASVKRELLTGKAFLIYWPHPWYFGFQHMPYVPNVPRMGLIR